MNVGFIGLGKMGEPIARNLIKAGHKLAVYNRTASRAAPLGQAGARVASEPADTLPADVVINMLADDRAVEAVLFGQGGLIERMPRGTVHVSMSTISVELSRRLAEAHAKAGQDYVAAPVFGRPEAAAAVKLFVVAAGAPAPLARCQPLFDAIGQRTFVVGAEPPVANLVKLSGNFLIAATIESLGEAIALVRKSGVDPQQYLELLTSTLFPAPLYKNYGGAIVSGKFVPAGFALPLGLKDIRLVLAAAEASSVPMPSASLVHDQAVSALARGYADHDWSVIGRVAAENAGLDRGGTSR